MLGNADRHPALLGGEPNSVTRENAEQVPRQHWGVGSWSDFLFLCDSDLEIGPMIRIMAFFFSHQNLTLGFLVLSMVSWLAQQGYIWTCMPCNFWQGSAHISMFHHLCRHRDLLCLQEQPPFVGFNFIVLLQLCQTFIRDTEYPHARKAVHFSLRIHAGVSIIMPHSDRSAWLFLAPFAS